MGVTKEKLTNSMISQITNDNNIIKNYRILRSGGIITHNRTRLRIYLDSKNQLIWGNRPEKVEAQRQIDGTVRKISNIYNSVEFISN